jgi:translation initiation factor 2 subunit 1
VPEEWIAPLMEAARAHIEIKQVKLSWIITATSKASDGVDRIRKILTDLRERIKEGAGREISTIRIYTIGAPRYRLDVAGHDPKTIDKMATQVLEKAVKEAAKLGVELSYSRLK